MSEKPFGPTAVESLMTVLMAVLIAVAFIAFCVGAFMIKAKCYYETGKALSGEK